MASKPAATPVTSAPADIAKIMAEIRARVKADVEKNKDKLPEFRNFAADPNSRTKRKAGELLHSAELQYLNSHYQYAYNQRLAEISSGLPFPLNKLVIALKRSIIKAREFLLRDYLAAERDYQAHLVRLLNNVSTYIDERDAVQFWELIRKIDYDINKAIERIDRINDDSMATVRSSERAMHDALSQSLKDVLKNLGTLNAAQAQQEEKLATLDAVAKGLEKIIHRISTSTSPVELTAKSGESSSGESKRLPSFSYLMFENRYRGSEDEISRRQEVYLPYFSNLSLPVLDIGCGRGEFLALCKRESIPAYGIDLDTGMVEEACSKGLKAQHADALQHLQSLKDQSLGGVIAIQVVEHLTQAQLEALFKLCCAKVKKGGKVIFETINPRSLLALSSNYFRDPTHVWPMHPDTMQYGMEMCGLKVIEVKNLSPVSPEALLRPVPLEPYMTPRWAYTIELLNRNFSQLNELIYGFQDYCIVAEV